ncbi:MFS general substrate transporter [Pleurostoma richardsiae]|uniref:MFS general substrate transporter n=1 Tax=Pleurostoma richardsiae TaxID=41990 RepID=A0AA38RIS6_9PEZI|nr:MFS general substrate transporter [Pleurostoma richardsiae]
MAWGILPAHSSLQHVPGTVLLEEQSSLDPNRFQHLKKSTHRGETIILVPQPSDDPNDPLNWPLWRRDAIMLLYAYCTILVVGGIGPVLSSLALELSLLFNVSLTKISLLTGYSLCATGASGLIVSAVSHKYGRRLPLVCSMSLALAGTVWGGCANSYNSLLGARILQGLSVATFESVIFSVVGDLYYVHERGVRVAGVTAVMAGLSNLPPILAGKIATTLSWRWVFWLLAIFVGIGLGLVILVGWETAFNRGAIFNLDLTSQDNLDSVDAKMVACDAEEFQHVEDSKSQAENTPSGVSEEETVRATVSDPAKRKTLIQRMALFSGNYSKEPFWKLLVGPAFVLYNPAVIWAVLLMSFPTLWLVAINLLVAQIFAGPPYFLSTAELGYLSAGPGIGGVLGSLASGMLSDPIIKWASRKNKGVYEPEFRLILILPAIVMSVIGYVLFGNLIEAGKSPAGMATLWGVAGTSLQFIMMVVGSYTVDAYRDISVEIFIATMVVKNFVFYGFSYFLNSWMAAWTPAKMFYTVAGIQVGLCLTTIPIWIFGKKIRAWWHKPVHKK